MKQTAAEKTLPLQLDLVQGYGDDSAEIQKSNRRGHRGDDSRLHALEQRGSGLGTRDTGLKRAAGETLEAIRGG